MKSPNLRRWRATLLATLLTVAMTVMLMSAFYVGGRAGAISEAIDYQREVSKMRSPELYQLTPTQRLRRVQALMADQPRGREILAILNAKGESLAGPEINSVSRRNKQDYFVWRGMTKSEAVGFIAPLPEAGHRLFIGVIVEAYRERVWQDWKILWVAALAIGAPTLAWLLFVRRRLDSRIAAMSRTFDKIGEGAIDVRILISRHHDEIDHIAHRVNGMLDRLGKLMGVLEDQSTHIRHEFLNGAARMSVYIRRIVDAGIVLDPIAEGAIVAIERERVALVASTEAILRLSQAQSVAQQFREQDLAVLAGEVVDMMEARAEEKEIALLISLSMASVAGDAGMLTLMAANLIENAIKYTPEGGRVSVSSASDRDHVRLIIEDSGPGIPSDMRLSVFEPRLRIASTEDEAGHGYGLAIVKAIVNQHRGIIEITESHHGGACFCVVIPVYSTEISERSRST